jgi:hypothetical protein
MSKSPTQKERVLKALIDADGQWVPGTHFLRNLYLSQYHARIWELQQEGYQIEASEFTDEFGFKSYRLIPKICQTALFSPSFEITSKQESR